MFSCNLYCNYANLIRIQSVWETVSLPVMMVAAGIGSAYRVLSNFRTLASAGVIWVTVLVGWVGGAGGAGVAGLGTMWQSASRFSVASTRFTWNTALPWSSFGSDGGGHIRLWWIVDWDWNVLCFTLLMQIIDKKPCGIHIVWVVITYKRHWASFLIFQLNTANAFYWLIF